MAENQLLALREMLVQELKRFSDLCLIDQFISEGLLLKKDEWYEVLDISILDKIDEWVTDIKKPAQNTNLFIKLGKPDGNLRD